MSCSTRAGVIPSFTTPPHFLTSHSTLPGVVFVPLLVVVIIVVLLLAVAVTMLAAVLPEFLIRIVEVSFEEICRGPAGPTTAPPPRNHAMAATGVRADRAQHSHCHATLWRGARVPAWKCLHMPGMYFMYNDICIGCIGICVDIHIHTHTE